MFNSNPFTDLSALISNEIMQGYIILMFILVVLGTLLDMAHKKSAKYFFENSKKAQAAAKTKVGAGAKAGMLVQTVASEVLTSSEFANVRRRISHLFTMYGFVIFVVSTVWLIFGGMTAPDYVPQLWHVGAAMLAFGGYWFWFRIRVDVSAEGHKWYQVHQADIFIVCLVTMATFALLWSYFQSSGDVVGEMNWGTLFFVLFIVSATTLFSTVLWSKFAHMFFKPAAALQKRVTRADGSRENLPADYDLSDPAVQAKFPDIPTYMGKNPENMGPGIKREAPRHY